MKELTFGPGAFSGFSDYRYGSPWRGKLRPILKAEKRGLAVDLAVDELRRWNQSPFQFEATVRHGIRTGLVLLGYGWQRADAQAELIVAEALHRIGAKRPTWEQGQRHFVEPRENCRWCGDPLSTEDMKAGFCSVEHARSARQQWGFENRKVTDAMWFGVTKSIHRLSQATRKCLACSTSFKPERALSEQKFCSTICRDAHKTIEMPPRHCSRCDVLFVPKSSKARHVTVCSTACAMQGRSVARFKKECRSCGEPFVASGAKALFCSKQCSQVSSRFANGALPKTITPVVFDFLAYRQGTKITDALFAEAA